MVLLGFFMSEEIAKEIEYHELTLDVFNKQILNGGDSFFCQCTGERTFHLSNARTNGLAVRARVRDVHGEDGGGMGGWVSWCVRDYSCLSTRACVRA